MNNDHINKERQQQRCMELAADGLYARANKALISSGPLRQDEYTERIMQEKHPKMEGIPDLSDLAATSQAQVPELDNGLVKMLKTFK